MTFRRRADFEPCAGDRDRCRTCTLRRCMCCETWRELDQDYDTPLDQVTRPYMGGCEAPFNGRGMPAVWRPDGSLAIPPQMPSRHKHVLDFCDLWRVPRPDPELGESLV